jgi:hypothetical protein
VDYLDSVSLSLSTAVLINFPRPRFAVLPVSLGVELVSLGGTVRVSAEFLADNPDRCDLRSTLMSFVAQRAAARSRA